MEIGETRKDLDFLPRATERPHFLILIHFLSLKITKTTRVWKLEWRLAGLCLDSPSISAPCVSPLLLYCLLRTVLPTPSIVSLSLRNAYTGEQEYMVSIQSPSPPPGHSALDLFRSFCPFFLPNHPFTIRAPEKRGRHGMVLKRDNHSLMLEGVKARGLKELDRANQTNQLDKLWRSSFGTQRNFGKRKKGERMKLSDWLLGGVLPSRMIVMIMIVMVVTRRNWSKAKQAAI